jgi:hypothetical protein
MAAYTTIDDPSAHFQILTYTGNASYPRNLTNDGNSDLKPDFIWLKNRGYTGTDHVLTNSSVGFDAPNSPSAGGQMASNSTGGENTPSATYGYISAHLTDGFTAQTGGTNGDTVNWNNYEFVAWQWKVNGGTTSSNTDGDLTSTVQVNQTAGISIFTYTGKDPIEPLDIGHGLGSVPDMFIIKRRNGGSRNWGLYHKDMAATPQNNYLRLNSANAVAAASTWWRNEAPTSTIIKTGEQADINQPNDTFVGYAFKGIQGYSKFGSYEGNGEATNGPFVFTGFSPAFVMIKNTETANRPWYMFDNKRRTFNPNGSFLRANTTDAEATDQSIDMLSNGFKIRPDALGSYGTSSLNHSSQTMVYMAFAQHPFTTSTGIPTTAR